MFSIAHLFEFCGEDPPMLLVNTCLSFVEKTLQCCWSTLSAAAFGLCIEHLVQGTLTCWAGPAPPPFPLWTPQPTPICGNRNQPIWVPTARGKFWSLVMGLENWFHPMCLYTKCSNLNGDFKCFISPHFGLGLCSHIEEEPLAQPARSAGTVQLLGRLAVLETHTL